MNFKNLVIYFLSFLLLVSCSTDEASPTESILDYANLEIGNYWVYQWYEIEPDGTESLFGQRDSVFISSDTLINGRTMYVRYTSDERNTRSSILFDSANTLYSYPDKEVLFTLDTTVKTSRNFGPLEDPLAIGYYSLQRNSTLVQVPAGDFECINFEGIIESQEQDYPYGKRLNSNYYSKNIGSVLTTTNLYTSPNDLEIRLVSFGKNIR